VYKAAIINLCFSVGILIVNILAAGNRYVDYTPDSELEGLYNLYIKGNVLLPFLFIYLIASIIFLCIKRRKR
jgi:hypothetical protein